MLMKRPLLFLLFLSACLPAVASTGPVLEVEQDQVFVHAIGRDFLPPALTAPARQVNDGYNGRGYDNPNVGWLRDRFPLQVHTADGRLAVVSYLSLLDPAGGAFDGSSWVPVPRPAEAHPAAKSFQGPDGLKWMEVRTLPLMVEGGNLLALPGRLLVGEKVLHENAMTYEQQLARAGDGNRQLLGQRLRGMQSHGWKPRDRDAVLAELAKAFEIPVDRIHVMPWMPGERTGHVDMYVGVLDAQTLAVPHIPEKLIADLGYEHERTFAARLNAWLDARASELAAWAPDVKVERVPMLPPKMLKPSGQSEFGFDAQFLTPVNWVMTHGQTFVPVFPQWLAALPAGQAQAVSDELAHTLAAHGHTMVAVPATRLLEYNGLLHCLTGQLEFPR